jgi:hypothetical protein
MLLFIIVLLIAALCYICEVWFGSSLSVYNCELGQASSVREPTRLSGPEFWGKLLPLLLTAIGVPLLFTRSSLGVGLLVLALLAWLGNSSRLFAHHS